MRELEERGLRKRVPIVAMSKGLVPPDGQLPSRVLAQQFGPLRVAAIGGPAHAQEMVADGAALVAASENVQVADLIQQVFLRAGVVCEKSVDPVGVELGGVAKNAAALAAGATEGQGLNAAGAAAGHIFAEVWDYAARLGARPQSLLGLAGIGDLVATALAPHSRNRRAGELLAEGVPSAEIPVRVGQAVEALETVPLLARALALAGVQAPVTSGLSQLIAGDLPLQDWTELVRTTVPSTHAGAARLAAPRWPACATSCASRGRTRSRPPGSRRRRLQPPVPTGSRAPCDSGALASISSAPRGDPARRRQGSVKTAWARSRRCHGAAMPLVLLSLSWENATGVVASLLLLGYLIYALIRAERF